MAENETLLRREDIEKMLGLGRTAIYNLVRRGELPPPLKVGPRASRWRKADVDEFIERCRRAPLTD